MRGSKSHESLSQRHRSPLRPSGSRTPPPLEDQIRRTTSMSLSPRKSQRSRTPRRSAAVTPVGGLSPTSSPRPRGAALPTSVRLNYGRYRFAAAPPPQNRACSHHGGRRGTCVSRNARTGTVTPPLLIWRPPVGTVVHCSA